MEVFKNQTIHLVFLIISLGAIYFLCISYPIFLYGGFLGVPTKCWFLASLLIPIVHQIYVLICWRLELYNQSISKIFGKKGFIIYKGGFAVLILLRPVSILFLAISNAKTLDLHPTVGYLIALILFIPSIYLFYSVKKYFGMDRAFGMDHFEPEKAKNYPLVSKGIFKYTNNGMYVFGFLILWSFGFLFLSKAALLIAFFNHVYIWIHYYYTEKPDMEFIYGSHKSIKK